MERLHGMRLSRIALALFEAGGPSRTPFTQAELP